MKITRILSASVLAGAVLLAGTACSMLDSKKTETSSSSSAKPSASQPVETSAPVDEQQAVADTINGFYAYVSTPGNFEAIKQAGEPLKGRGATATDEELHQLAASLPEGFQYFDISSPDLIRNSYVQLLVSAGIMSTTKMEMNAPTSAVTVTGDTATVDATKIDITVNGKKVELPSSSSSKTLKLRKNDSGEWVMISDSSGASATATGEASATPEESAPASDSATTEESAPADESATTEESAPADESATTEESAPADESAATDTSTDK